MRQRETARAQKATNRPGNRQGKQQTEVRAGKAGRLVYAIELRFGQRNRAVIGLAEPAQQLADADGSGASDHAQRLPAAPAWSTAEQGPVPAMTDQTARDTVRMQALRNDATVDRAAQQHNAALDQIRVILQRLQNHQTTQAVSDQVYGGSALLQNPLCQASRIIHQRPAQRRIAKYQGTVTAASQTSGQRSQFQACHPDPVHQYDGFRHMASVQVQNSAWNMARSWYRSHGSADVHTSTSPPYETCNSTTTFTVFTVEQKAAPDTRHHTP
jgi:hypothetical protein